MTQNFNDEFQQMDEREFETEHTIDKAVSIEAPISSLKLQKMITVDLGTTVADVVKLIQTEGVACVLITDKGKLVGIFTERDVIRKLVGKGLDHTREIVDDYMTPDPHFLFIDDPIAFALNRMYDGGYRHVPIIDTDHKPIGIVGILDIISHLAVYYSDEIINLPPDPMRVAQPRPEGG